MPTAMSSLRPASPERRTPSGPTPSSGGANTYHVGIGLGGLATTLPAFAGTNLQVGALAGTKWEVFIQQMTDLLAAMEIDSGASAGGFFYDYEDGVGNNDGSTAQWGYIGLESAEVPGLPMASR